MRIIVYVILYLLQMPDFLFVLLFGTFLRYFYFFY